MTNEPAMTLVLRDDQGDYYLLASETLEAARIPEERTASLMAELEIDDAEGFIQGAPFVPKTATFELRGFVINWKPAVSGVWVQQDIHFRDPHV